VSPQKSIVGLLRKIAESGGNRALSGYRAPNGEYSQPNAYHVTMDKGEKKDVEKTQYNFNDFNG
jgi:hypothetical protein